MHKIYVFPYLIKSSRIITNKIQEKKSLIYKSNIVFNDRLQAIILIDLFNFIGIKCAKVGKKSARKMMTRK